MDHSLLQAEDDRGGKDQLQSFVQASEAWRDTGPEVMVDCSHLTFSAVLLMYCSLPLSLAVTAVTRRGWRKGRFSY